MNEEIKENELAAKDVVTSMVGMARKLSEMVSDEKLSFEERMKAAELYIALCSILVNGRSE